MHFLRKPTYLQPLIFLCLVAILSVKCKKDNKTAANFPHITINLPSNCDTISTGDFLNFDVTFSGSTSLSAYAIDIHNDFDKHIHQGSDLNCKQSAKKDPYNPFIYLQLFDIPPYTLDYQTSILINIPESIDTGDYHVYVRLANLEGYQTNSNVFIKIVHKQQ